jgi:ceramide glucosyltransferase
MRGLEFLALIAGFFACTALAFYVVNLVALVLWRRQRLPRSDFAPPISILKPLKGCDEGMYEAFRSHCAQDYPEFEIIFGVNSATDPAVEYVRRLQQEFANQRISLLTCREVYGANRKASNLAHLVRAAQYSHLVINDSDIRVPPDYLKGIARWFADPAVGMVTCLYRPTRARGIWSKLEALGIVADFIPGVLTARMIEGKVHFGLGSTMAVDRAALEKIGGMEVVCDYLADDYELGRRISDAGYRVVIPDVTVETSTPRYTFREFWQHQLRWGRTVRSSRLGGYLGLISTFGFFWALLLLLTVPAVVIARIEGTTWSLSPMLSSADIALGVFAAVIMLRVAVLLAMSRALDDRHTAKHIWLLPLRDLITPVVWAMSLFGNEIVWRGERFAVRGGKLKMPSA